MNLRRLHRRVAVLMGLSGLLAFAGGAGFEPLSASLATGALLVALFWQPSPELSARLERLWLPVAILLVGRAVYHMVVVGVDVVIPVVDLLLLLLAAEALRSLEARNGIRLYSLSFSLLLASAAYRPGLLFAVAFVSYVMLGTVALAVGHLRREAEERNLRRIDLPRPFFTSLAGLSGVTLAVSAVVFLAFPRVTQNWAGRGEVNATSIAGFADEVSLGTHGSTIYGNPSVVLRVEFPDGRPGNVQDLYWRGRSYDHFDGVRWSRSGGLPPALAPRSWYEDRWRGPEITQRIYQAALDVRALFALHPVLSVETEVPIQPHFDNAGDFVYWGSATPVFQARSRTEQPDPRELRAAEGGFIPARSHFLQLPDISRELQDLADSLARGHPTRYDRAREVEQWLRTEFSYTLDLPDTPSEATLDHFLFERRRGHCEYFATAMTVLLRSQGIPARIVNGFLGGEWSEFGQYLAVTQNQAHSWVEVWFPDYGWVAFDPTPPGTAGGRTAQGWAWTGLIFLDGMEHRWNKWILDYGIGEQSDLAQTVLGMFLWDAEPEDGGGDRSTGWAGPRLWGGLLLAALGAGGLLFLLGRRPSHPPESRLYLNLRNAAANKGITGEKGSRGPLTLQERIRERTGGSPPADRLIEKYLRVRFGTEVLDDTGHVQMRRDLSGARSHLRSLDTEGGDGS